MPLELYFFLSGLEKHSAGRLAVGGLLLGFHFNIYLDAQIIVVIVIVYLLIAVWLCRPLVQRIGYRLGIFWLGAGLTALPMLVYAWRHPNEFFNRLNVDGTFQSGWLADTMATTGQNALRILADRFTHALLSLNYYPAVDFYNVPAPCLMWSPAPSSFWAWAVLCGARATPVISWSTVTSGASPLPLASSRLRHQPIPTVCLPPCRRLSCLLLWG